MTFFEFIVPMIAPGIALGGYVLVRAQVRALDGDASQGHHPAE